jgi:hypothetical protein
MPYEKQLYATLLHLSTGETKTEEAQTFPDPGTMSTFALLVPGPGGLCHFFWVVGVTFFYLLAGWLAYEQPYWAALPVFSNPRSSPPPNARFVMLASWHCW